MKKILIIEDDEIVANIYRNKLIIQGYQVEVAYTGEAGFELVKTFRPDAVILDLVLPKLSGVELMTLIRAEAEFAKLPIIVFSNTYLTNMVQAAWKAGATKCLSKASCTPRQLLEALSSCLGVVTPATAQPVTPVPRAKLTAPTPSFDADIQLDVRGTFAAALPDTLIFLRTGLKLLTKAENEAARARSLQELVRHTHSLTSSANLAGFAPVAQLAEALEALFQDLHDDPAGVTASTARTAAAAVDCLGLLFERAKIAQHINVSAANVLVVDDDPLSRRAITQALEKVKIKSTGVGDPNFAYQLLSQGAFNLIFLDVDMPDMTGHELCTKLRGLDRYKATPVVFVTGLTDFEARANSMMSGGNDFIAKPFHFMELGVKTIVHLLRSRIATPTPPTVMARAL